MYTSINASIQAIAKLGESCFKFLTESKEKQSETALLKDRDKLQEASDVTEELLWLVQEYIANDSQFTMWLSKTTYNLISKEKKKIFRYFYKNKLTLKNKIYKKRKEFEKVN